MYCMLDENYFLTRDFVSLECSVMPRFPPSHYVVPGSEPSISHTPKQVSTWCRQGTPCLGAFGYEM